MKNSLELIEREKEGRNLIDGEIKTKIDYSVICNDRCLRCQSNNFQSIVDSKLKIHSYTAYEVEYHSRKCRICGYNAFKDKPLNFKIRFNKWIGKYYWKKLK